LLDSINAGNAYDIIVGPSLAQRTINLPLLIVKIRFWLPCRLVVAGLFEISRGGIGLPEKSKRVSSSVHLGARAT
jgi:hypothetical protein